jgi:NAD(P)-dependent dehydrogenase (short-subunit alcohol dehydrogenase family)
MSRVAVVTGAASGMGPAVSRRLADRGHRVALLDLQADAVPPESVPATCLRRSRG